MSSNYEWQRYQAKERFQARLREADEHRLANTDSDRSTFPLPLRVMVPALLGVIVAIWFLTACTVVAVETDGAEAAAEIHVVLNDHGPKLPAFMPKMIQSYRGGCTTKILPPPFPDSAIADGLPGPNTCRLSQFVIFTEPAGGFQIGPVQTFEDEPVNNGAFTVSLDFGDVFTNEELYLEVGVRLGDETGSYTVLLPRQPLLPVPLALHS